MSISKRHHYIPQFLIKRFADTDKMLYLYDKEKSAFAKEKRSPKSVFFEMNRNTLEIEGIPNDNLEKLYAELDAKFAADLTAMAREGSITVERLTSLLLLVSSLKWRLPANDSLFEKEEQKHLYEYLPITITVKNKDGSDNTEAIRHLIGSDTFKQTKRIIFPFLPFYQGKNLSPGKILQVHENSFINSNNRIISILGDAPLIEDSKSTIDNFGNFILPLGNAETFICTDSPLKKVNSVAFYASKDLAMFHNAQKYVVCSSKDHLVAIIETYKELERTRQTHHITEHIFKFV